MKTQTTYYQVFAEVNGIRKEIKRYQSVTWLRKFLDAHPTLLYYRVVAPELLNN